MRRIVAAATLAAALAFSPAAALALSPVVSAAPVPPVSPQAQAAGLIEALEARLARSLVHAVVKLISSSPVARDSIRSVTQGRALVANGRPQHFSDGRMEPRPLVWLKSATRRGGVNPRKVENLGGVEVAHSGQGVLIQ